MAKKKNTNQGQAPKINSIVYSTHDTGNSFFDNIEVVSSAEDLKSSGLELRVYKDKKQRRGKVVTVVTGYRGNLNTLKELGKKLKSKFGVGGSIKNNEIIIQGYFTDKTVEYLKENGYKKTKRTGG